ncbi:MAG: ABC transporter permease [Planctomycetota bacterium]
MKGTLRRSLTAYGVLTAREVEAYFLTPLAYIVLTMSLLITGLTFYDVLQTAQGNVAEAVRVFFGFSVQFWLVILLVPPLITMRLFAEEKRSGTFEMLLTAPVTDTAVVLAKFTGALIFFLTLWLPTLLYVAIVKSYGSIPDAGALLSTYIGIALVGALLLAIGCLCSSLSTNQIVAAITALVLNLILFFVPFFSQVVVWPHLREFLEAVWPLKHFVDSFSKGVLDTGYLAYYVVLAALLLFLTVRVVEARKWK